MFFFSRCEESRASSTRFWSPLLSALLKYVCTESAFTRMLSATSPVAGAPIGGGVVHILRAYSVRASFARSAPCFSPEDTATTTTVYVATCIMHIKRAYTRVARARCATGVCAYAIATLITLSLIRRRESHLLAETRSCKTFGKPAAHFPRIC